MSKGTNLISYAGDLRKCPCGKYEMVNLQSRV